ADRRTGTPVPVEIPSGRRHRLHRLLSWRALAGDPGGALLRGAPPVWDPLPALLGRRGGPRNHLWGLPGGDLPIGDPGDSEGTDRSLTNPRPFLSPDHDVRDPA